MLGLLDAGGGMRGIFAAGLYDYCIDHNIQFDYCVGVSAGASNIIQFLSGGKKASYDFYSQYTFRKEYLSLKNFFRTGNLVNLEYFLSLLLSSGEIPLDFSSLSANKTKFDLVATDAKTGHAVYFNLDHMKQDDYRPIQASCSVPIISRPCFIDDVPYYDGGMSDPIPIHRLEDQGCDYFVIVLTRPKDYRRPERSFHFPANLISLRFPQVAKAIKRRPRLYNQQLEYALSLEREGKAIIIAPKDIGKMQTFTRDKKMLEFLYKEGYANGKRLKQFFIDKNIPFQR